MKCKDFSDLLSKLGDYLASTGADESANALKQLVGLFAIHPSRSVSDILKVLETVSVPSASFLSNRLGQHANILAASSALVRKIGKAAAADDLDTVSKFLTTRANLSVSEFFLTASVRLNQSAVKSKPKPVQKPLRQDLVDKYLRALEQSLGDDPGFRSVFARLQDDGELGSAEFAALAKQFSLATVKSRPTALKKIMERHAALMTSRARSAATAGRIAG